MNNKCMTYVVPRPNGAVQPLAPFICASNRVPRLLDPPESSHLLTNLFFLSCHLSFRIHESLVSMES